MPRGKKLRNIARTSRVETLTPCCDADTNTRCTSCAVSVNRWLSIIQCSNYFVTFVYVREVNCATRRLNLNRTKMWRKLNFEFHHFWTALPRRTSWPWPVDCTSFHIGDLTLKVFSATGNRSLPLRLSREIRRISPLLNVGATLPLAFLTVQVFSDDFVGRAR